MTTPLTFEELSLASSSQSQTEQAEQIWLSHFHLTNQENQTYTAYLVSVAQSREDFQQQITDYLAQERLQGQAQLVPLPITTWFNRHGFDA